MNGPFGGFAPALPTHAAAIEIILEAIDKAGYLAQEVRSETGIGASEASAH